MAHVPWDEKPILQSMYRLIDPHHAIGRVPRLQLLTALVLLAVSGTASAILWHQRQHSQLLQAALLCVPIAFILTLDANSKIFRGTRNWSSPSPLQYTGMGLLLALTAVPAFGLKAFTAYVFGGCVIYAIAAEILSAGRLAPNAQQAGGRDTAPAGNAVPSVRHASWLSHLFDPYGTIPKREREWQMLSTVAGVVAAIAYSQALPHYGEYFLLTSILELWFIGSILLSSVFQIGNRSHRPKMSKFATCILLITLGAVFALFLSTGLDVAYLFLLTVPLSIFQARYMSKLARNASVASP